MTTSVWTSVPPFPRIAVRDARRAELDGWDGVVVPDSQSLCADAHVQLALVAQATERIGLGPGVSNPVTRHPAVTASAMATLQSESGGRAVLGIGRGDSALAHIGHSPAPLDHFERYLVAVKAYLHGTDVPFEPRFVAPAIRPVDDLALGTQPSGGRLRWLRPNEPVVPIEVAVTGPKVIALAACIADGIALCVGADPARVEWAIGVARRAREDAGLDPDGLSISAYINAVVHDDRATARTLVGGALASFSRFSVMHGVTTGGAKASDGETLGQLHRNYNMMEHGRPAATHAEVLPDEFVDANAIVGPPDECLARFAALRDLGVGKFIVMALMSQDPAAEVHASNMREVLLPEMKRW